jgi:flagellar biosynthetic protein FlhB
MEAKSKRRQFGRKLVMQRLRTDVPRADVVVTNPTHLAIAIKYDPETMRAPRVVAKGADHLALVIRQIALQHAIPLVEKKPLAQALYKGVEVGQEVPPELYQAIAEILAYVYELSGKEIRRKKSA